ncbi:MAG TPA: DUF4124 domain-containing protein [Methylomirabilota bacterium]
MSGWPVRLVLLVALTLVAGPAAAQPGYRWVDEQGNVHYAGRRDQVPERYRDQLPSERRDAPPKPRLTAPGPQGAGGALSAECSMRFRGTERRRGAWRSFPNCDACWKALKNMRGEDAARAECVPSSVESYR